jgi:hypothetical protein
MGHLRSIALLGLSHPAPSRARVEDAVFAGLEAAAIRGFGTVFASIAEEVTRERQFPIAAFRSRLSG